MWSYLPRVSAVTRSRKFSGWGPVIHLVSAAGPDRTITSSPTVVLRDAKAVRDSIDRPYRTRWETGEVVTQAESQGTAKPRVSTER
jgi:hypothetical protein